MKLFRALWHEDGTALIEFSIMLPALVLLLIGTMDYAIFFEQQIKISHAAAAGAAFGTMTANSNDLQGMQSAALRAGSGVHGLSANSSSFWNCTPGGPQVDRYAQCSDGRTAHQWVEVDVSATLPPLFAFPGMPSDLTLHASAVNAVPWRP